MPQEACHKVSCIAKQFKQTLPGSGAQEKIDASFLVNAIQLYIQQNQLSKKEASSIK